MEHDEPETIETAILRSCITEEEAISWARTLREIRDVDTAAECPYVEDRPFDQEHD